MAVSAEILLYRRAERRLEVLQGYARLVDPWTVEVALNGGGTAECVEIYAFAPGLNPEKIEANIDRGVLTIAGERDPSLPRDDKAAVHINERFSGRFRRVVSLPDDIDPDSVTARYRDGVLNLSIRRRESALPRRIQVN